MNLSDLARSYVRTIVPLVVGWLLALGLRYGLDLTSHAALITTVVTAIYYAVVRQAEVRLSPRFGWLLGLAVTPKYSPAAGKRPARKRVGRTRTPARP